MTDSVKPEVLIAGSVKSDGPSEEFDKYCEALGQELAKAGLVLIAGSIRKSTADYHVLRGAGRETERNSEQQPLSVRFIRPAETKETDPFEQQLAALGRFAVRHELFPGTWQEGRSRQVKSADVVVLVGGGSGTSDVANEAVQQGKEIIAVPNFGGAAESLFRGSVQSELLNRMRTT